MKGNQPRLRRQLAELPGRHGAEGHRSAETGHRHRQIRVLKVVTIAAGIEFPHARPAVQITRAPARTGKKGRWHTETVYTITDLARHETRPEELAAWIRRHWQIENSLPQIRDLTYAKDLSQIRTGTAPQVMATLRNLAINPHRLTEATNIATTLQHHAHNTTRPLQLLKTI